MKKSVFSLACFVILLGAWHPKNYGLSSLAKNDPYPIFSTSYPYEWLLDATKNYLKGDDCECYPDHISIAASWFYQKASRGKNYDKESVPLGDLEGRWHMLGLLYGPVPPGETLVDTRLGEAKKEIFGTAPANEQVLTTSILVDCSDQIGFFSVPIRYRKQGFRFEAAFQLCEDFGLLIQGSYADIKQTVTNFDNLFCGRKEPCPKGEDLDEIPLPLGFTETVVKQINDLLMSCSSANRIFREQGINSLRTTNTTISNTENVCDFHKSSFEDLRLSFWLRHIFQVNAGSCEWPEFLFIPFVFLEGSYPGAKQKNRHEVLAVPFGNDGHASLGFTAGFHLDFLETVEISFFGGMTHFFARNVNDYRLPTHPTQSGVFPFATDVKLQPGTNFQVSGMLHAYRFIDKLSAHVDFTYVSHAEDTITLKNPDLAEFFLVSQQECLTKFTSSLLTTALNYEISPNFTIGFAVQWPIKQRNAYRSTTYIGSIIGIF